jgi:hypothetical protein
MVTFGLRSFCVVVALRGCMHFRDKGRWGGYGLVVALVHALASVVAWAFAIQARHWAPSSSAGAAGVIFSLLLVTYLLIALLQFWYWWSDLHQRCPVCLDRLMLHSTEGTANGRCWVQPSLNQCVCTVMAYWLKAGGPAVSAAGGSVPGGGSRIATFRSRLLTRAARSVVWIVNAFLNVVDSPLTGV